MVNFIPAGFEEGQIKPLVISRFSISERKLVVCEYGFMIGVFDYLTGGKIADFDISNNIGLSNQEYIEVAIKKAKATLEYNPNWLEVLNKLPIIN